MHHSKMDNPLGGATTTTRFRHGKTPSSDRYLAVFPSPHQETSLCSTNDELNEDDIFCTNANATTSSSSSSSSPNHHSPPPPPPTTPTPPTPPTKNFGILAALPETERAVFNHKASVSSSASSSPSSSFRLIPKKPPLDRKSSSSSLKFQSAPVNVPVLSEAVRRNHRALEFDDIEDDGIGGGEMLPPHELVARRQTPVVSCSVLEGVGRTLKGSDLRQVRNAVWRQTGFLD